MSDLPEAILNILIEDSDEKTPVQIANEIADAVAKQIRQQIGRELLEAISIESTGGMHEQAISRRFGRVIREVCQLENNDDNT